MPRTDWGWMITPEELRSWFVFHDHGILAIDKPAHVLCHRSKHGPWSSLISACRELTGAPRMHMPSRLDRETSGALVIVSSRAALDAVNLAVRRGYFAKTYHAIVTGVLTGPVLVDQPIGVAEASVVGVRRAVRPDGQPARTLFEPLAATASHTFVRATPLTGRTHQIRVHASWLGHAVAGDKIYGPDENLFVEFLRTGWTPGLQESLSIERHALHCSTFHWNDPAAPRRFFAPLPLDWREFAGSLGFDWSDLERLSRDGVTAPGAVTPPNAVTSGTVVSSHEQT
ncbi:MAG: pseudouridine synthase [Bryobacteraceae bacterium]